MFSRQGLGWDMQRAAKSSPRAWTQAHSASQHSCVHSPQSKPCQSQGPISANVTAVRRADVYRTPCEASLRNSPVPPKGQAARRMKAKAKTEATTVGDADGAAIDENKVREFVSGQWLARQGAEKQRRIRDDGQLWWQQWVPDGFINTRVGQYSEPTSASSSAGVSARAASSWSAPRSASASRAAMSAESAF